MRIRSVVAISQQRFLPFRFLHASLHSICNQMTNTKHSNRLITFLSLMCLSLLCAGCDNNESTVIQQPADAAQEMEDYESMMNSSAKEAYGK